MSTHNDICKTIISLLTHDHIRLTPGDLFQMIRKEQPGVSRNTVREAVHSLVDQGRLAYVQHFSISHLELNFRRPVRVAEHILLSPGNCRVDCNPGDAVVELLDGTVFGGGDHPTTRLVLRGLDTILTKGFYLEPRENVRALDVGTGSGVLALAALKLGVSNATGIDIDPVACNMARKNAALNQLAHRFEIRDTLPDKYSVETFDLILTNLRTPTLKQLFFTLRTVSAVGAIWVLSGFRSGEQRGLEKALHNLGGRPIWRANACGWAAFAVNFPD